MPGKSKKGGGLESSPVYKMKGFSGFGNESPLTKKKRKETTVHRDDEGNVTSKHTITYRKDGTKKKSKAIWPPESGKLTKATETRSGKIKKRRTRSVIVSTKFDKKGNVKWGKSGERSRKSRKSDLEG